MNQTYIFSDCFEEVPYDGPTITFTDPISGTKDVTEATAAKTAKSCQLICQKEAECNYFTWIADLQGSPYVFKCYLKSEKDGNGEQGGGTKYLNENTEIVNQRSLDKIISGPKYCIIRK